MRVGSPRLARRDVVSRRRASGRRFAPRIECEPTRQRTSFRAADRTRTTHKRAFKTTHEMVLAATPPNSCGRCQNAWPMPETVPAIPPTASRREGPRSRPFEGSSCAHAARAATSWAGARERRTVRRQHRRSTARMGAGGRGGTSTGRAGPRGSCAGEVAEALPAGGGYGRARRTRDMLLKVSRECAIGGRWACGRRDPRRVEQRRVV